MKKILLCAVFMGIFCGSNFANASDFSADKMLKMIPVAGNSNENTVNDEENSQNHETGVSSPLENVLTGSVKIDKTSEIPNKKTCKKILKKNGYKFDDKSFLDSVKASDETLVKLYLNAGMNSDAADKAKNTALIWASFKGNTEIMKSLVENGADVTRVNVDGFSPLHAAVESGNIESVKYLISKGANVNAKTFDSKTTPLHTSSFRGDTGVTRLLLENGADFNAYNSYGASPLTVACFYDKTDIIKILINAGADANLTTDKTPLKAALTNGNTEIFEILINNGADINTADDNGLTLLEAAAEKNDVKTAKFLIEKGAKTDCAENREGALYKSTVNGNTEMAELLVENGADVNEKEPLNSVTVFQAALLNGHEEIVDFFLKKGADLHKLNNFGFSAADIALATNSDKLENILKKGGLFSKPVGEVLVKYGCSVKFDEEKNMFSITLEDAKQALSKLDADEKLQKDYEDYMKKTRSYRERRKFTPDKHAFKIYPLFFEILK